MKITAVPSSHRRQSGLTLVELLIAMVLGLIVISAVVNTYVGSTRSARFSKGLAYIQENGRFGIITMQRGIRLAGFAPEGDLEPFDITNSSSTQVAVRVTDPFDCNGVSTDGSDGVAVNTYAHNAADNTITCTGSEGAIAMPVVEGVDGMRLLWGVDEDDDNVPDNYVVHTNDINPNLVVALRVALLMNSNEPIRSRKGEETHVLFDQEITTNDRIARNVFSTTVMLRNID